jgi:serine/threonine protein kinase
MANDCQGSRLGLCLCLEYCSRGSLKDILNETREANGTVSPAQGSGGGEPGPQSVLRLPWERRCSLALGIARGMAELHKHIPVIFHRDLKVRLQYFLFVSFRLQCLTWLFRQPTWL